MTLEKAEANLQQVFLVLHCFLQKQQMHLKGKNAEKKSLWILGNNGSKIVSKPTGKHTALVSKTKESITVVGKK